MGTPLAVATAIKGLGVVVTAVAAGGTFALTGARARALSALFALGLAPLLVVAELWDSDQIRDLRDHPGQAAGAVFAALVVVSALAVIFRERPWLFPLAVIVTLPVRIPVSAGDTTTNLLLPLYVVVGAGVVTYVWARLQRDERFWGER